MAGKDYKEVAISGGIELIKLLIILALQEAQRSKMSEAEIDNAFIEARVEFLENDPGKIPDV